MKRAWQITGTTFAILFAAWAEQSWRLSLTDSLGPGPGFFPFWLSLIGLVLSVALVVRVGRAQDPALEVTSPVFPGAGALRNVLVVLGSRWKRWAFASSRRRSA